jgi:Domain of unknown function (DUF222)
MSDFIEQCTPAPEPVAAGPGADDAVPVPLEHLEARICELAGHLTAAICQFLLLVADFDAREGWAGWEMASCAAWLSWKCQIAPGTAREEVRVARALGGFPLITAQFAAGRLSYAKVRALTRIATPDTEAGLAEMATPMTAAQLERFARAHRRVTRDQDQQARARRKLTCHDAAITPATIIPPNSGERLDLHLALWIALTNARTRAERRQREQQAQTQAA